MSSKEKIQTVPLPQKTSKPIAAPSLSQGQAGKPQPGPQAGKPQPGPQAGKPQPGPQAGKPQPGPQAGKPQPGPQTPKVEIRPIAEPMALKKRHWGLLLSFVLIVFLPVGIAGWYLWFVATDQYASTAGFTVRQEENGSASDLLGGLARFAGSGAGSDADVLYEYIQSQELVEAIDRRIDLRAAFARTWPEDPLFALWSDASIEDLMWYWPRAVRISFDQSTGLINFQVRSSDPDLSQQIARAIIAASQAKVNLLNRQAREDLMGYAKEDVETATQRLKQAREALTTFRTRTQIVDPEADIQGRMGVLNNLQQQLAEALIEYDIVRETVSSTDPRLNQTLRRIRVIQQRIEEERETFAESKVAGSEEDYPTLMAEFESLMVDREFAEETYRVALAALDIARANASRQSRYLAVFIEPTLAESAEYPQREILLGLTFLFLGILWAILALSYYSFRDRR